MSSRSVVVQDEQIGAPACEDDEAVARPIYRYCQFVGCPKRASFGSAVTRRVLYCSEHKEADHDNLTIPKCMTCGKPASFAPVGETRRIYCKDHVPNDGLVYETRRVATCRFIGCTIQASYGKPEIGEREYCYAHGHVIPGYQPLHGLCEAENCPIRASFGRIGSSKKQFCSQHAAKDGSYKNLHRVNCETPLCQLTASHGEPGTTKRTHCTTHGKEMGMINLSKSTCCIIDGCTTWPSYASTRSSKAQLCKKHIPKNGPKYYNVTRRKLCQYEPENDEPECTINASFGPPTSRSSSDRRFCLAHKPDGWISVLKKFCQHIENNVQCDRAATCGHLFSPRTLCFTHKSRNMITKNNPKCQVIANGKRCGNRPLYTKLAKNYPQRCEEHKTDGDKNVIERICKNCDLKWFIREGCEYCEYCDVARSTGATRQYQRANEEMLIAAGYKFRTDRTVDTACSRKRPDFVIENLLKNNHITVIEIDEEQHRSYNCVCEQNRMIELFQAFGGEKVTFIRFNPYPFHYTTDGMKHSPMESDRSTRLLSVIRSLCLHPPEAALTVIYMYYNGDTGTNDIMNVDYEKHLLSFPENRETGRVIHAENNVATKVTSTKSSVTTHTLHYNPVAKKEETKNPIVVAKRVSTTLNTDKVSATLSACTSTTTTTTKTTMTTKTTTTRTLPITKLKASSAPTLTGAKVTPPSQSATPAPPKPSTLLKLEVKEHTAKRSRDEAGIDSESNSKKAARLDKRWCSQCCAYLEKQHFTTSEENSGGSGDKCRKCLSELNIEWTAARKERNQPKMTEKKLESVEKKRTRELQRAPDHMIFRCGYKKHMGDRMVAAGDYDFASKPRRCQNDHDLKPRFKVAVSCRACTKIKNMIKHAAAKKAKDELARIKTIVKDDDDNDDNDDH